MMREKMEIKEFCTVCCPSLNLWCIQEVYCVRCDYEVTDFARVKSEKR